MRKLFFIFTLSLVIGAMYAFTPGTKGNLIPASQLPVNGLKFLETYFKGYNVLKVEKKWDGFEIDLVKGYEIELDNDGLWNKVEGEDANYLPASILNLCPAAIANYIGQNFKDWKVKEVEKKSYGYKIELENGRSDVDLKFNSQGELLKTDY